MQKASIAAAVTIVSLLSYGDAMALGVGLACDRLQIEHAILAGGPQARLIRFLDRHQVDNSTLPDMPGLLLAQAQAELIFQEKCSNCHGTVESFARKSLTVREGGVIGVKTKVPIATFLKRHRSLTAEEAQTAIENLIRVLSESGRGPGGAAGQKSREPPK